MKTYTAISKLNTTGNIFKYVFKAKNIKDANIFVSHMFDLRRCTVCIVSGNKFN